MDALSPDTASILAAVVIVLVLTWLHSRGDK